MYLLTYLRIFKPTDPHSTWHALLVRLLPEHYYVTFGYLLSQIRPSSVCNVQGVEAFSNISSPLCTLAIL